jgi:hypothetical protein
MERRSYLKGIGTVSAAGLLAGCSSSGDNDTADDTPGETSSTASTDNTDGDATGLLATSVSDMPGDIDDFESLVVTIAGVWIKPAAGDEMMATETMESTATETSTENTTATATEDEAATEMETDADMEMDEEDSDGGSGRRYIEFSESHDADLVQLKGSKTQLLEEQEVPVSEYEFLQLDVTDTNGTLTNGNEATVETPGNAPLKFNQSFEVREDERTTFIADFTPFKRGNGSYLIRPVASETQVLYGDETPSGDTETMEESTETMGETTGTMDATTETMDGGDDENQTSGNATSAGN